MLAKLNALLRDCSLDETLLASLPTCRFSHDVLDARFKSANFASFVRQLNFYGFRKALRGKNDKERDKLQLEFQHPMFQRARPDLIARIRRKTAQDYSQRSEVETLRAEIVEMRETLSESRATLEALNAAYETARRTLIAHGLPAPAFTLVAQADGALVPATHAHGDASSRKRARTAKMRAAPSEDSSADEAVARLLADRAATGAHGGAGRANGGGDGDGDGDGGRADSWGSETEAEDDVEGAEYIRGADGVYFNQEPGTSDNGTATIGGDGQAPPVGDAPEVRSRNAVGPAGSSPSVTPAAGNASPHTKAQPMPRGSPGLFAFPAAPDAAAVPAAPARVGAASAGGVAGATAAIADASLRVTRGTARRAEGAGLATHGSVLRGAVAAIAQPLLHAPTLLPSADTEMVGWNQGPAPSPLALSGPMASYVAADRLRSAALLPLSPLRQQGTLPFMSPTAQGSAEPGFVAGAGIAQMLPPPPPLSSAYREWSMGTLTLGMDATAQPAPQQRMSYGFTEGDPRQVVTLGLPAFMNGGGYSLQRASSSSSLFSGGPTETAPALGLPHVSSFDSLLDPVDVRARDAPALPLGFGAAPLQSPTMPFSTLPPLVTQPSWGSFSFTPASGAGGVATSESLLSETAAETWLATPVVAAQPLAALPAATSAIAAMQLPREPPSAAPLAPAAAPAFTAATGPSDKGGCSGGSTGTCPSGAGGEQLLQRPDCITRLQRQLLQLPPEDQAALVQRIAARGADDLAAAHEAVEAQPVARKVLQTACMTAAEALAAPAAATPESDNERDNRRLRCFVENCPPELVAAIFLPLPQVRAVWARLGQLVKATAAASAATAATAAAAGMQVAAAAAAVDTAHQAAAMQASQPARLMLAAAQNTATANQQHPYTSVA